MAVAQSVSLSHVERTLVSSSISTLRRDAGCSGNLNWRCEVALDLDPEAIENRLLSAGWKSRCQHPAFRVFRNGNGHEVAWVLASGRVQIRVSIIVDPAHRKAMATEIYETLTESLTSECANGYRGPTSRSHRTTTKPPQLPPGRVNNDRA